MITNLEKFHKSREEVFNFFKDYTKMMIEEEETKGTELKILTPKQILQRLPIALAQVKTGNNSESLLNEIRRIVYSFVSVKRNH